MQVMTTNSHKKIVVLGTGGTIAGKAQDGADNIGYKAGEVGVDQLLAAIPGLQRGPCQVVTEQVAQLDSKDMSFAVWQQLAARVQTLLADADVQGIVITHGLAGQWCCPAPCAPPHQPRRTVHKTCWMRWPWQRHRAPAAW